MTTIYSTDNYKLELSVFGPYVVITQTNGSSVLLQGDDALAVLDEIELLEVHTDEVKLNELFDHFCSQYDEELE